MTRARAASLLALALAIFVALYRFNTLGGALGGFDDDHFVPLAYAKQVQAGEQPLRDFAGTGLQGVWPSLTFEISALAQKWFGNNLRSEAVLTIVGITAGALATFIAGTYVASPPLAFGAALLSVFVAPKLYNYPKVLVLALGALGMALYVRRPTVRHAGAFGVLAAIAFLFRHDYAVYLAVGITAACLLTSGVARGAWHVVACGLVSLVLLTPSLWFVHRHAGLQAYLDDSVLGSQQEAARTDLPWPQFAASEGGVGSFFTVEQNAVAWLYYLHFVLPVVVVLMVWRLRTAQTAEARTTLCAVAVMCLFVAPLFLRGNTAARFGDMGPLVAVLLAGGAAFALRRASGERPWTVAARRAATAVVLVVTTQSIWTIGGVTRELDTSGWSESPQKIMGQAARRWTELAELPAAYWTGTHDSPTARAVRYLHACTDAGDRLLMMSYQPEVLPLADRRFAAGRASVVPGFLTDERHQRELVERWRRQHAPIVLVEEDPDYPREIPLVHRHLTDRYARAGTLPIDGGTELGVFIDRSRPAASVDGATGLPCLR